MCHPRLYEGHEDEEDRDAGYKLSLKEEPGIALSTNNSSHFRMQNENIVFSLKELRVSGRLPQVSNA